MRLVEDELVAQQVSTLATSCHGSPVRCRLAPNDTQSGSPSCVASSFLSVVGLTHAWQIADQRAAYDKDMAMLQRQRELLERKTAAADFIKQWYRRARLGRLARVLARNLRAEVVRQQLIDAADNQVRARGLLTATAVSVALLCQ